LSAVPRLVRKVPSDVLAEALDGDRESSAFSSVPVVVRSPLPTACWSWLSKLLNAVCCEVVALKSMLETGRIAEMLMGNSCAHASLAVRRTCS